MDPRSPAGRRVGPCVGAGALPLRPALASALLLLALAPAAGASDIDARLDQARALLRQGRYQEAHASGQAIADDATRAKDDRALSRALIVVGDALYYQGRRDEMMRAYQRALEVSRRAGDPAGVGWATYSMSFYWERTQPKKMLDMLAQAQPLAERSGDMRLQMEVEEAFGTAYWSLSRYADAFRHYQRTEQLARGLKNLDKVAVSLANMGLTEQYRANNAEALRYLGEALSILEKRNDPRTTANTLGSLGDVYRRLGDVEKALSFYEKALALHRQFDYKRGQGAVLLGLAELQDELGRADRAESLRLESLKLTVQIQDERRTVLLLCALADQYTAGGRLDEAQRHFAEAARRAQANGDPGLRLAAAFSHARLARARRDPSAALRALERVAALARPIGDTYQMGLASSLRAEVLEGLGRTSEAIAAYREAVAFHASTQTASHLHLWHGRLARLYAARGDAEQARRHYDDSLLRIEGLQRLLAVDQFRRSLFREVADLFRSYAHWLAARGETTRAWEVLEQGRARDLRLRLAQQQGGRDLTPPERDALARLSALQRRLREESLSRQQRSAIQGEIALSEQEYERAARQAGRAPEGRARAHALRFPIGAVVVEYALEDDGLVVFSHRDGRSAVRLLPLASPLAERVRAFWSATSRADAANASDEERELFRLLLGEELAGLSSGRLVVVPDGPLQYLPFAALRTPDGAFLAERFTVSLVPSLGVLADLHERAGGQEARRVLAVAATRFDDTRGGAVPLARLAAAGSEARQVGRCSRGSQVLVDATESELKALPLAQFQVLHFATHTLADERRPERSSIVLRPDGVEDGYLQAREIYRMSLPCRMVVVSGCRSGRGELVAGEGVLGLSHALYVAGARSLVTSLWDVSDEGTSELMSRFYRSLQDRPIAEALREAQGGMIRSPRWSHPAHWAGFFVSGAVDQRVALDPPPAWIGPPLVGVALVAAAGAGIWWRRRRRR